MPFFYRYFWRRCFLDIFLVFFFFYTVLLDCLQARDTNALQRVIIICWFFFDYVNISGIYRIKQAMDSSLLLLCLY